jgi:hypothetical protein
VYNVCITCMSTVNKFEICVSHQEKIIFITSDIQKLWSFYYFLWINLFWFFILFSDLRHHINCLYHNVDSRILLGDTHTIPISSQHEHITRRIESFRKTKSYPPYIIPRCHWVRVQRIFYIRSHSPDIGVSDF